MRREVLEGVVEDLRHFKSEASEKYVETEEFEEVLENALRRAADERNGEKRCLYRAFLTQSITAADRSYNEQIGFLRTLEDLQRDHLLVLRALLEAPPSDYEGIMGSPTTTSPRTPRTGTLTLSTFRTCVAFASPPRTDAMAVSTRCGSFRAT